jgi:hypothetical protein
MERMMEEVFDYFKKGEFDDAGVAFGMLLLEKFPGIDLNDVAEFTQALEGELA